MYTEDNVSQTTVYGRDPSLAAASVTSQDQLVVQARLRRKYGVKPGTEIGFIERDNEILFQPVTREYIR